MSDGDNGKSMATYEPGACVRITSEQQSQIDADNSCQEELNAVNAANTGTKQKRGKKRQWSDRKETSLATAPMQANYMAICRFTGCHTNEEIEKWSADDAAVRMERLEAMWQQFEGKWQTLGNQIIAEAQLEQSCDIYEKAMELYLRFKSKLRSQMRGTCISKLTGNQSHLTQVPVASTGQLIQIQLSEPLKLPTFSGLEVDWAAFRAVFEDEVHNKTRFSKAQKMRHLLGALRGRAEQIYKNWPTTDENSYNDLWSAIYAQYGNEFNTIRAHLQTIHELKPLQLPTCESMRKTLDAARNAFQQLQRLIPAEKVGEYMLLHQLEWLLDYDSKIQWAVVRQADELPTLAQMFGFWERRASLLSQLSAATPSVRARSDDRRFASSGKGERGPSTGRGDELRPPCDLCPGESHWPFKCAKFKVLPIADRDKYVLEHRMCRNCFSFKHLAAKCPDKPCPRCQKHHNSCLCPANMNIGGSMEGLHRMQRVAAVRNAITAPQNASSTYNPK